MTDTIQSPKKNGWGGARSNSGGPRPNSGGARPGAGRKPKPKVPPERPNPSILQPRLRPGPTLGLDYGSGSRCTGPKQRGKLVTRGYISNADRAYIYIGRKSDTVFRIGMSSNPSSRCKGLGIKLLYTVEVVVSSARMVETYTLQELGALAGDTEYVICHLERAIEAVNLAYRKAQCVVHVDPALSAEEARLLRIKLLSQGDII